MRAAFLSHVLSSSEESGGASTIITPAIQTTAICPGSIADASQERRALLQSSGVIIMLPLGMKTCHRTRVLYGRNNLLAGRCSSVKGHVRRRGKSWAVVIELERDPLTGKRRQKWYSVRGTKKDAERRLAELLHQVAIGEYVEPTKLTVGEFLQRWLRDYAQGAVRWTTLDSYRWLTEKHILPALGHIPLSHLKPLDLQQFYAQKLAGGRLDGRGGLAPRSVQYMHGLLREALGSAVKWQLLARNPAEAVDPPRRERAEMQVLDVGDVQAFLEAARGTRYYALWVLDVTTGLRRGEMLGLRWQDIDLEAGTLAVRQTLVCVRGKVLIQPRAKTQASLRVVSLPEAAVEALRTHRAQQEDERRFARDYQDNDLVFCTPEGRPVDPNNLAKRYFKPLLRQAGLPDIRIQDLRHTHATMLLGAGVNLKLVSDRLGHTTTRMTADIYSHVLPRMRDEVAATVDKILSSPEGLQTEGKRPKQGR